MLKLQPMTLTSRPKLPYGAVLLAFGLALLFYVLHELSAVLAPLGVAFVFSYLLDPVVDRLEHAKIPRAVSALGLMGVFMLGVYLFARFAIPELVDELSALTDGLPERLANMQLAVTAWLWDNAHIRTPKNATELGKSYGSELPAIAWATVTAAWTTLVYVRVLASLLIIPLFTMYLLIDFDRIARRTRALIPRRWEKSVIQISREIHHTLGGWIRGQATAGLVLSVLYSAGLRLTGIPLAIPIGVMTGMMAFVPYAGFGLGCTLALLVAILHWSGWAVLLHIVLVMLGVQLLDALIVTPRVVGSSVGLGALEVLIAIMASGTLFGFFGVLFAVPLGAVFKIIAQHATRAYLSSELYRKAATPPATSLP